jgi:hypothetical protein
LGGWKRPVRAWQISLWEASGNIAAGQAVTERAVVLTGSGSAAAAEQGSGSQANATECSGRAVAEGWCLETAAERWWENDIRCCSQEMN